MAVTSMRERHREVRVPITKRKLPAALQAKGAGIVAAGRAGDQDVALLADRPDGPAIGHEAGLERFEVSGTRRCRRLRRLGAEEPSASGKSGREQDGAQDRLRHVCTLPHFRWVLNQVTARARASASHLELYTTYVPLLVVPPMPGSPADCPSRNYVRRPGVQLTRCASASM